MKFTFEGIEQRGFFTGINFCARDGDWWYYVCFQPKNNELPSADEAAEIYEEAYAVAVLAYSKRP